MKLYIGQPNNNPFEVPEAYYIGTFFRYRPAKKSFCTCPLDHQNKFDFSLADDIGRDEGFLASVTLCTNRRCESQRHGMRLFLDQWLGDRLHDFVDSEQNIDLDLLLNRKADIEMLQIQGPKHPQPYSKLAKALPPGTLINN